MLDELQKYLQNTLATELEIKLVDTASLKKLPVYIRGEYTVYQSQLFQKDLLFLEVKGNYTTNSLGKHLDIIEEKLNKTVVAIIDQVDSYQRLRLIEKHIPFIVPGKQMYMPKLLVAIKEYGITPKEQPKIMTPATQFLLLYHLQIESLEGQNLKSIANILGYDSATITRSASYLHNMELCVIQGTKEKSLHFSSNKKELWEKSEPLMSNPVKRSFYYSGWADDNNLFRSNDNALAHYTNLNEGIVEHYAARPGYLKFLEGANLKRTAKLEGNICVEEWKYDPDPLSKNGFVDPLSLYLCFRDNEDERIEIALEQIINEIEW